MILLDYMLSPTYDLINTKLHVDDTDFALDKGLIADNFKSEHFKKNGHSSKIKFVEFALRMEVTKGRVDKLLNPFIENRQFVETLINRSFLSDENKRGYLLMYRTKRKFLISN